MRNGAKLGLGLVHDGRLLSGEAQRIAARTKPGYRPAFVAGVRAAGSVASTGKRDLALLHRMAK
jgi:hypothetical protein